MTVLSSFLESSLNFLSKNLKKHYKLSETQFEKTVKDKIACQTHLEKKNYSFKHIFGIIIEFPIQKPEKTLQN